MTIFVGQRTRPVLNCTIYNDTKISSSHIPYTNNIAHPVIIISKVTRSSNEICLMKCNTFYEDKCCISCFDNEGTKILNVPRMIVQAIKTLTFK